ncbi:MAG: molecular chaperone TorD family protein [Acidobacteriota bacterium]|jgi:nitrate reductase delta subunit
MAFDPRTPPAERRPTTTGDGLVLERLAGLFRYPGGEFSVLLAAARAALASGDPETAGELERFARAVEGAPLTELQELYTRTFDLDPVCALEIGWHLYGEGYDRGRFLVRLRELHRELGIDEAGELPDHLISVLPALARLGPEDRTDLGRRFAVPAVARMLAGFAGRDNPYEHLVRAVDRTLRAVVGAPAPAREAPRSLPKGGR